MPGPAPEDGLQPEVHPAWALVHELHSLMKALMLHEPHHAMATRAAASACEAIHTAGTPFTLQFVASGLFMDRTLVPLDFMHYGFVQALTVSLARLSAHEVSFDGDIDVRGALRFGQALAAGARGQTTGLKHAETATAGGGAHTHADAHAERDIEIAGMAWREIPHAQSGIDAEGVDPEVAAVTHTVIGLSVTEQIAEAAEPAWPWHMGLSVVRRLEKGLAAKEGVAMRVVEFAPDGWNRPRRALSAALLVLEVLTRVDADSAHRRAAAHATLALGLEGLADRGGMSVGDAALALERRIHNAPVQARSGVAPQCLLVATLVHLMTPAVSARKELVALGVTDLIQLAYQMELERCPLQVPFDLSRADLLAGAVQQSAQAGVSFWVRALIKVCGAVPVGAFVQLADGRTGTVIEPGPAHDPWRPVVFVDGQRVIPDRPVMLVPPNKRKRVG